MSRSIFLIIVSLIFCLSCTTEDMKMKKVLKSSISESMKNDYKYDSYILQETILKNNLVDSISSLENKISASELMMERDSAKLQNIRRNMEECRKARLNTLYFLRSTYDDLLENYSNMEADIVKKLEELSFEIDQRQAKIDFWNKAISESDSPIVFYKVKHFYRIRGVHKDTTLLIYSNYKLVN